MMSSSGNQLQRKTDGEILRDLFIQFGMDWFITSFPSDPDTLMARFRAAAQRYDTKITGVAQSAHLPSLSVSALHDHVEDHRNSVETFLQVFASSCSAEMLAMTWTLVHDADVASVELSFEQRQSFELEIELTVSPDEQQLSFQSDSVFDMAVLRHFGLLEANNSPVVSGIFPLNLTWDDES